MIKNVSVPILDGIYASLYRHILNFTSPKTYRDTTVTPQKLMKLFACCRLGARNTLWDMCVLFIATALSSLFILE